MEDINQETSTVDQEATHLEGAIPNIGIEDIMMEDLWTVGVIDAILTVEIGALEATMTIEATGQIDTIGMVIETTGMETGPEDHLITDLSDQILERTFN